jgi:hypothetical protein
MRFKKGNQAAAKRRWNAEEIRRFQKELRGFRESLNYSRRDLELALGYHSGGVYVKILEGGCRLLRQPSERFLERLQKFKSTNPQPKPPWLPDVYKALKGELVPREQIVSREPRKCLECESKRKEGRSTRDSFFWPDHPQRKVHPECKEDWDRRRRWFDRCKELGCENVVSFGSGFGCRGGDCLRKRPWFSFKIRHKEGKNDRGRRVGGSHRGSQENRKD